MRRRPLPLAAACVFLACSGCGDESPRLEPSIGSASAPEGPVASVRIAWRGVPAEEVDEAIATVVLRQLAGHPAVRQVVAVSRDDGFEAFVRAESGTGVDELLNFLRQALSGEDLPVDAVKPVILPLDSGIPKAESVTSRELRIVVDRQKLAAYGLTSRELASAFQQSDSGGTVEMTARTSPPLKVDELNETVIATKDGVAVHLWDVAAIKEVERATCIVRKYPAE